MRSNFIIISLVLIYFVGCNKQSNSDVEKLLIGDAKILADFDDLFQEVKLIFLDSSKDALLSDVAKTYIANDMVYIYDSKDHNINVFDINGNSMYNTRLLKGRARNEYMVLSDYIVDAETDNIELFDPQRHRIMQLDNKGKFKATIKLPSSSQFDSQFDKINNDKYILGNIYRKYTLYDTRQGEVISEKQLTGGFPPKTFLTNDTQEFHHCKDSIFFIPRNDKYIYSVDNISEQNIFSKRYELILTDNPLTPSDIEGMTISQVGDFMTDGQFHKYSTFNRRFITDQYIVVSYILNNELYTYFYNRSNKSSICIENTFASGNTLAPTNAIYDNTLYAIVEAQYIPMLFPKQTFPEDTMTRINNISDSDNMVLVKYTLKTELFNK